MFKVLLLLVVVCGSAWTTEPEPETDARQKKRGVLGSDGWVGLPSPAAYGQGQPWTTGDPSPWKGAKVPAADLQNGWQYGGGVEAYSRGTITLGTPSVVKTVPVYITRHVVLEKPVPVPEPVPVERPYYVPIEKLVPVPIEKIVHRPVPVPVPVPVPQAIPIPVEHAVPIPVKHPVAVPVQQPYPVAVKQAVPFPVPVPYPVAVHQPFPHQPHLGGLAAPFFAHGYEPVHGHGQGHLYAASIEPSHVQVHHPHVAFPHVAAGHGLEHGHGGGYGSEYAHGYEQEEHLHHHGEDRKKKRSKTD